MAGARVWLESAIDRCAASNPLFTQQLLSSVLGYGKAVGKVEETRSLVGPMALDGERRGRLDRIYRRVGELDLDLFTH